MTAKNSIGVFFHILLIINCLAIGLMWLILLVGGIMFLADKEIVGLLSLILAIGFWKVLKFCSNLMYPDCPTQFSVNYKMALTVIIFGFLVTIIGFSISYLGWVTYHSYFPETITKKELYISLVVSFIIGNPFLGIGLLLFKNERIK